MRLPQGPMLVMAVALFSALAGCASATGQAGNGDSPCAAANVAVGETSKALSAAAIGRGKIKNFDVPFWLPGGTKARSALADRQTRRIEELEAELAAKRQERAGRGPRP